MITHMTAARLARRAFLALAAASVALPATPRATLAQGEAPTADARRAALADSLIEVALERARAADTSAALRALERATAIAPNYAPAFFQRGAMLARTTTLGAGVRSAVRRREAVQHLNRALDLDPGNPRYMLELGLVRLRTPFFRLDAERLFDKALRAAEERRDLAALAAVHYELGQVYERRYETIADRNLVDPTAPFNPALATADPRYVRDFLAQRAHPVQDAGELDRRKAEAHYRAALVAEPASDGAAAGLFALLAEGRRYEELLRATDELRISLPHSPRRLLARGLALHRLGRSAEAEPVLDSALSLLPEATRREMTSLGTILRRRAADDYERLTSEARARLDSLYWDTADPLALAPGNEARAEFLARLAYADLRFSSPEFNHEGWRTDRGVIYARYGPPTRVATFMAGDVNSATDFDASDPTGSVARITTVWWWEPTNLAIVFTGPPAMNTAWFADDFRAYAASVRETQPVRLEVPAARAVDSVGVQVARFRPERDAARSPGDVDVAVFADVPTGRLLEGVDLARAPVVTGFVLRDDERHNIAATQDSLLPGEKVTARSWRAVLPRGEYGYRVEALQPASGNAARGLGSFGVAPFPESGLALSDVVVARSIVPRSLTARPRGRADFDITANGSLTFQRGDTLYLYWEEYGLTPDPATGAGRSRVELSLRLDDIDRKGQFVAARILGGVSDAIGLSAEGDTRVSLRFDRAVPLDGADRAPSFLAVALGGAPYGTYTLELTVTDLVAGRSARRERVLRIPRP